MLEATSLHYRYHPKGVWVVDNVSLSVAPGEVVGLSGPSGRGKTTLAKVLAGYVPAHQGRVSVDGQPLPRRGFSPVQLIFQHPELAVNPRWRIRQILEEAHVPAPNLVDALQIEPGWFERFPHELSGGELQRIAVARTLTHTTRYLIADEMTAMLDANTQAQIWHTVMAYARNNRMGVLIISHDAPLLARLCQRVITL